MENVRKILEISTGHLPEEVAQGIDSGILYRPPAMMREEGWLFHVEEDPLTKEHMPGLHSRAFERIMSLARDMGCAWVLFDRDVPTVGYLPTSDW